MSWGTLLAGRSQEDFVSACIRILRKREKLENRTRNPDPLAEFQPFADAVFVPMWDALVQFNFCMAVQLKRDFGRTGKLAFDLCVAVRRHKDVRADDLFNPVYCPGSTQGPMGMATRMRMCNGIGINTEALHAAHAMRPLTEPDLHLLLVNAFDAPNQGFRQAATQLLREVVQRRRSRRPLSRLDVDPHRAHLMKVSDCVSCPVCITEDVPGLEGPCAHGMCSQCFAAWHQLKGETTTCPLCRAPWVRQLD